MIITSRDYKIQGNRESLFKDEYSHFAIIDDPPAEGRVLRYRHSSTIVSLFNEGEPALTIAGEYKTICAAASQLERETGVHLEEIIPTD